MAEVSNGQLGEGSQTLAAQDSMLTNNTLGISDNKTDNVPKDGEGADEKKGEDEESEGSYDSENDPNDVMECEGFVCPKHLVTKISPMEFEEMVNMFKTYDVNGSGDIDKHEARKILQALDMECTLEKAEELIAIVDTDGSGEIEFDEFCEFIVLIKEGDERYKRFDAIMDSVSETPLGKLERAANTQGFKLKFQQVEHREATATNPQVYVVELIIDGVWFERSPETGFTTSTKQARRFQGLGTTNKEAKFNACKAGAVKLRQMMPGVHFKEGQFDDEWYTWIDENLARGVDPMKIVGILAAKGFHPHRNDALMQRIVTWQSFDLFLARNGNDFNVDNTTVVDTEFRFWVEKCSRKGIDGAVILKVLQDRAINIMEEHPHFAQKLKNNELGYLMDLNGMQTRYMTFWTACEDGNVEDVMIYLECRQDPNEETHSRTSGEVERPLSIAASAGQVGVMRALLQKNPFPTQCDINAVDRRGRTALHRAAMNGHLEACRFLADAGIMIFEGDFSGNTALHMAAFYNHVKVVDYLAWRGQEHTRFVCSDKVRPKPDMTFNQLAAVVFEKVMQSKLTQRDLRRVEKRWLNDAAKIFRFMCDDVPKSMIAHSCEEIMDDVLERYDPRPETGCYVIGGVAGEQIFVPTIPSPIELATMLRYTFRQAATDAVNSWKRTALHVACDNNKVDSHKEVIFKLMENYGCNTSLKDRHLRRPIDLLMVDRAFPGVPSTTQVREEFIVWKREIELEKVTIMFEELDTRRRHERQAGILEACAKLATEMSLDLWDIVRTACMEVGKTGNWIKYEDPECLNYFYVLKPANMLDGERYGPYQWTYHVDPPAEIRLKNEFADACLWLRMRRSEKLNLFGRWQQYRDKHTKLDYYYDEKRGQLRFAAPKEATWAEAQADCKRQDTVGYAKEWDIVKDNRTGNLFYRNSRSNECTWDRPIDAVVPEITERFCTALGLKGKTPFMQKYYVCEQCNRAWKTSVEGAKVNMRICEPCIFRCHDGHKGIRYVSDIICACICEASCRIAGCKCNAQVISESQLKRQRDAYQQRVEASRAKEHNILMPPIFAMVPTTWPDGSPKRLTGWQLCRRPPLQSFDQFGAPKMTEDGDNSSVQTVSTHASTTGSLFRGQPVPEDAQKEIAELEEYPFEPPPGLPSGWVEVCDPEEPENIRKKSRVLVKMSDGVEFIYGTVLESVAIGFYKVKFDVPLGTADGPTQLVIHREQLKVISVPTFFCHVVDGKSAWTVADAAGKNGEEKIFQTTPLCMTGPQWLAMYESSETRRAFGKMPEMFEELQDNVTQLLFFANVAQIERDRAAMRIQRSVRRIFRFSLPFLTYSSVAYSMYPSIETKALMRLRSGWSYLRRRSTYLGEFASKNGEEWEEYVDNDSSEYFYWQEASNRYQWDKPDIPDKGKDLVEYIPNGTEVLFRFPGDREEITCLVTRMRFDDQTGGDCYDIVAKFDKEKIATWLPRLRVKLKPAGNEEMLMKRSEKQWKNVLRRAREKQDRLEARKKELQDEADRKRVEEMRLGIVREGEADKKVPAAIMLARFRQTRLEAETRMMKEEMDRELGFIRREKTRELVQIQKEESYAKGVRLSRADLLSMTRAIEMQLAMEERVKQRNAGKLILDARKAESVQRVVETESKLRDMETVMTTPRSGRRRALMRKLHVGMRRQMDRYMVCEWGCGDWVRFGFDQLDHQMKRCTKRILPCALGCTVKNSEEEWLRPAHPKSDEERALERAKLSAEEIEHLEPEVTYQQWHEQEECVKRLVICPRQCLEWVCFEVLEEHLTELCTKRPAEPIFCRLGCGAKFGGLIEKLIEAEDELMLHETEQCEFRVVRCNWSFPDGSMCAAQMQAKDRAEHRDYHLVLLGITTYTVAGTYLYRVPKSITRLKLQCWGAGGGSGYFKHRRSGAGGGGAYVEALLIVEPYDVLEIVVGSGGGGGTTGTEIEIMDIDKQREIMKVRRLEETFLSKEERIARKANSFEVIDANCGITLGGLPGGGEGYGGGGYWACGGGGGYTIVSKRTPKGNQALLVAGGGGGGGSVQGLPGGDMGGALAGSRVDPICGGTATATAGGIFGDSGTSFNSKWPAVSGEMWKGGNGSEFGAGGGGGYYGGGGGGTQPGIGGGGGGGSSYVYQPVVFDYVIVPGNGFTPGGMGCDPPLASGAGEWDKVGGHVGQGAPGHLTKTTAGNAGCVRVSKPGFY